MLRQPVAQGLIIKLRSDTGVLAIHEPDYPKAVSAAETNNADAILIEITESGEYDATYCLELCNRVRAKSPGCRILLLCPEQDEPSVLAAVEAVRAGRIDDFLFYDASTDYIISKLLI